MTACAALCAGVLCVAAYAILSGDLPAAGTLASRASPDTTKIYDRNGHLLFEVLDPRAGRRTRVALDDLPQHFRQAILAVEDANFYSHPGVDPVGIVRAIAQAAQEERVVSGGSTITQQLARQLLLSQAERESRTVTRKLREMILAWRLTQAYSKDTVLEMYLNEVYFGQLAYGAEAAARTYFGKPARELDLAESALLAGLIQSPAAYNPLVNFDAARERQQVVLGLMVKNRFIDESEAELAGAEALHFAPAWTDGSAAGSLKPATAAAIRAPHFVVYVLNLLEAQYGAERVNTGGLRVVTTLDLDLQERAEAIVSGRLADLARQTREEGAPDYNVHDAALVALDPANGDILAMAGSADYFDTTIDGAVNVALAYRQPGSAIKPITYAAAFAQDYTAATVVSDVPASFMTKEGEPYQPENYDRIWHGPITLRQALATSSNMVAVKVLDHVGLNAMIATARALGISTFDHDERFGLSLTLGGGEVTLLDLTSAYAAFAHQGRRVEARAILSVDGLAVPARSQEPAISPQIAYLITNILSDDLARIPAFGEDSVLKLDRPAAAKTGTTSDFRDNWTIGYTPDLVVGVWAGNANNAPMYKVTGITGAGPIWHDFMEAALANRPARNFERPAGLVEAEICDGSGMLATEICPRRRVELFIAGTEPLRRDNSYQAFEIDSATGLLWVEGCHGPREKKLFHVLPPEAQAWGREQGIEAPPVVNCRGTADTGQSTEYQSSGAGLIVTSPAANSVYALTSQLPAEGQRLAVAARPAGAALPHAVTIVMDGRAITTIAAPPYSTLWQITAGEHTVQAIGIDAEGRRIESPVVRFRVE
jgi:1A family penicillin-binding protein